jgi:hypothetical protein
MLVLSKNVFNSCRTMIKVEASLIGSLGLNPNTVRRGESSRLAFLLPVASVTVTTDKLESADAEKRQADLNNRELLPRSGRLTDYTREFVTWVMRPQANYRIEQPVMRNVVILSLGGLMNINDIKG